VKLYVTYGFGYSQRNCYSVVEGEDVVDCMKQITEVTDGVYAFSYYEDEFRHQPERYGLTEIPLQRATKDE
jgi:hypothetical protein